MIGKNNNKKRIFLVLLVLFMFLAVRIGFSEPGDVNPIDSGGNEDSGGNNEGDSGGDSGNDGSSDSGWNSGSDGSKDTGGDDTSGDGADAGGKSDSSSDSGDSKDSEGDSSDSSKDDTGDDTSSDIGGDLEEGDDLGDDVGGDSDDVPDNTPDDVPDDIPNDTPDDVPNDIPNEIPGEGDNPNDTPDDIPDTQDDKREDTTLNLCLNKNCNDNNLCTNDYCEGGGCYNIPVADCKSDQTEQETEKEEEYTLDKIQLRPEDAKYVLLNEFPGTSFGVEMSKKEYGIDEDVWTIINAPEDADVELSFNYDGFQQYIKIPKEKGYPLDYSLPLPRNIEEGIYVIRAAIYYAGVILKTDTYFRISGKSNTLTYIYEQESLGERKSDTGTGAIIESNRILEENWEEEYDIESIQIEDGTSEGNIKHEPIKVGEPVKWLKNISIGKFDDEIVKLEEVIDIPEKSKNLKVIEADQKNIIIEFETEAPIKIEEEPVETEDEWKKEVVISSDEEYTGEYEYKDVYSETDIKETEKENIMLYWKINGEKVDVTDYDIFNVTFYDTNSDGLIDKISWITPHLSTQEFEIVITLTTSTGTGLTINLLGPDNDNYKENSNVEFKFVVSYNKSLNLWCNLAVDNEVKETISVLDGQETIVNKNIEFSEGSHDWSVSCKNELGNTKQSSSKSFIIDLTPPAIELNNDDPDLSLMDSIDLSFTATDNLASSLDCSLILNGKVNETGIIASSGSTETITLTNLENGTYEWGVSCLDTAGNSNTSLTQTFYIDTKREFSIITNKEKYTLGEGGIYTVIAPYGSEVTLVITTPKSTTVVRDYEGPFPTIDRIDFADYPGTYIIDGLLNYNGALKEISINFDVTNTLTASIRLDADKITPGSSVEFTAHSTGGIGDVSYSWDFGDDSSSTEKSVTHTYSELGTYGAKLTVTDSKDNKITKSTTIRVKEQYTVDVIVTEKGTGTAINGAKVYLQGEEKSTDSSGKVSYSVFRGKYGLFVKHSSYYSYLNDTTITEGTTINVGLEKGNENYTVTDEGLGNESAEEITGEESTISNETEEGIENNLPEAENEDIAVLLSLIEDAVDNMDNLDSDEKEAAAKLNLRENLDKAKKILEMANRDLNNLEKNRRGLSQEEIDEGRRKIDEDIETISSTTIKAVDVLESDEFVKYPTNEDIKEVSIEFLKLYNITLNKKKEEYFIEANQKIQSLISYTTKVKTVEIEYLSGDKKKITLIVNSIDTNTIDIDKDLSDKLFITSISKDIVENVEEIEFLTEHKVIKSDPIIEFDLTKTKEIVYYLKEAVDLEKLKSIKSVLVYSPEKLEFKGGFGITGFAIFSKIRNIDNPLVVIEVIVIIILLIVYLMYQFNLADKLKKGILLKNKELVGINGLIKELNVCLENNEVENASVVYGDVMKAYKKLSSKAKAKVGKETSEIYNRIMLAQLNDSINITLAHLKDNDTKQAQSNYETIKGLYKQLPKEYKAGISERCKVVFEKLAAVAA